MPRDGFKHLAYDYRLLPRGAQTMRHALAIGRASYGRTCLRSPRPKTPTPTRHAVSGLSAVALTVTLALSQGMLDPAPATAATPPRANYSYYVDSTDTGQMQTLGCRQGQRDNALGADSAIILDFGGQVAGGSELVNGTVVSEGTIRYLAAWFAYGYYSCSSSTSMNLAIGTNNDINVSTSYGQAWAQTVIDTSNDVVADGYGSRVSVVGAIDAEPDYSSRYAINDWESGYENLSGAHLWYDYGSASGCPTSGTGGCDNGWLQSDLQYLSWGAPPAYPFPEIYNDTMALEWANISNVTAFIGFSAGGTLSQALACLQTGNSCPGTDIGPDTSWNDLASATGQSPSYSDDIGYSALS